MSYGGNQQVPKTMMQPANLMFRFYQNQTRVTVWLFDNVNTRIEGQIVGYDEKMNLVLDQAAEVHMKSGSVKQLGRIMLKGDNVTLIQKSEDSSKK